MRSLMKGLNLGVTLPAVVGRCWYSSAADVLRTPNAPSLTIFRAQNPPAVPLVPVRWRGDNFTGSRRKGLIKERKAKQHLERQLQSKYGVCMKEYFRPTIDCCWSLSYRLSIACPAFLLPFLEINCTITKKCGYHFSKMMAQV